MTGTREVYGVVEDPRYPKPSLVKAGYVVEEDANTVRLRVFMWPVSRKMIIKPPSEKTDPAGQEAPASNVTWETLKSAARRTGYAYNTFKKWRYLGILPFPVHEDRLRPGQRPKITVRVADVNAWKEGTGVSATREAV